MFPTGHEPISHFDVGHVRFTIHAFTLNRIEGWWVGPDGRVVPGMWSVEPWGPEWIERYERQLVRWRRWRRVPFMRDRHRRPSNCTVWATGNTDLLVDRERSKIAPEDVPGFMWGDGFHDDSPALQSRMDDVAAAGGGAVRIPPGRFRLS